MLIEDHKIVSDKKDFVELFNNDCINIFESFGRIKHNTASENNMTDDDTPLDLVKASDYYTSIVKIRKKNAQKIILSFNL